MKILCNGEPLEAPTGWTIADLLQSLELSSDRVAVEVNLDLVPRGKHAEAVLNEGDQIEVVTLRGGG